MTKEQFIIALDIKDIVKNDWYGSLILLRDRIINIANKSNALDVRVSKYCIGKSDEEILETFVSWFNRLQSEYFGNSHILSNSTIEGFFRYLDDKHKRMTAKAERHKINEEIMQRFAKWWNDLDSEDPNDYDHTLCISSETIERFFKELDK